jgi:hypothetical protein
MMLFDIRRDRSFQAWRADQDRVLRWCALDMTAKRGRYVDRKFPAAIRALRHEHDRRRGPPRDRSPHPGRLAGTTTTKLFAGEHGGHLAGSFLRAAWQCSDATECPDLHGRGHSWH